MSLSLSHGLTHINTLLLHCVVISPHLLRATRAPCLVLRIHHGVLYSPEQVFEKLCGTKHLLLLNPMRNSVLTY